MKLSRLLVYGAIGIIGGLLFENKALFMRQRVQSKTQKIKKKLRIMADHVHHQPHHR